jgi:hypothetical protein
LKGSGCGLIEVLPRHLPGRTKVNNKNTEVAYVSAEIRIEYLPNTILDSYLYSYPRIKDLGRGGIISERCYFVIRMLLFCFQVTLYIHTSVRGLVTLRWYFDHQTAGMYGMVKVLKMYCSVKISSSLM